MYSNLSDRVRALSTCRLTLLALLLLACAAQPATADTIDIFVANTGDNNVYEIPSTFGGATVGPSQVFGSGYTSPYALAARNGTVYVGDTGDGAIYSKAAIGGPAGTGSLFTTAGTLYDMTFADSNNLHVVGPSTTVHVFNSAGTAIGTYGFNVASGGSGGITYSPGTGIYLTNLNGGKIQLMTGSAASYSDATPALLAAATIPNFPQQIKMGPDGNLYVAQFTSAPGDDIFRVNPSTGVVTPLFPGGVTIGATTYQIQPVGLAIGPDGLLYFGDYNHKDLFRSNLDGSNPEIVAMGFNQPTGIAFVVVPEPMSCGQLGLGAMAVIVPAGLARRRRNRARLDR